MTINCRGQLIDLSAPKVMGILNITPDSFYDGGQNQQISAAIKRTEAMLNNGATFIDIGGYSSRPGADDITLDQELKRVLPVIEALSKTFGDIVISIDTFRAKVAQSAIEAGAALVNDISAGLLDNDMLSTVGALNVPYVMMHMRGTPQTMKGLTYYGDVTHEVIKQLSERIVVARASMIKDIIADPGFGFAKTTAQNFELLSKLQLFQHLEVPILAGISRKSMIYKTLNTTPDKALNGTTALNMIALQKGAKILRVHDVKEAVECVQLYQQITGI